MNWFDSIWQWFVGNKDAILAWITSANATGLIAAVVVFVKQYLSIKANTKSNASLSDTLKQYSQVEGKVTDVIASVKTIAADLDNFKKVLTDNLNTEDSIVKKIDAMLNVQQIAYSKLKDDQARNAIDNIIVNAKYVDEGTRSQLLNEIEKFKKEAAEIAKKYQDLVAQKTEAIEKIAEPEEVKKTSVPRY